MKKLFRIVSYFFVASILLIAAVVFLRPSAIVSKQDAKSKLASPASHFLKWRDAEVHYTDEGKGFPILMIHGFGGSYMNFDALADAFKDSFRVIRVDLPGFGLSDFPSVKDNENYIQDYNDYMRFMLDTLHIDSLYVIGNSMGGGIAWLTAGEQPERVKKLVLLNSAGYDTKAVADKLAMFKYKSVGKIFDRGMPMFMSKSGAENCYADKSKVDPESVIKNNISSNREGNLAFMLALARSKQFPDTTLISRVQCPTLIVWGKQDKIIPVEHAERFHHDIKNSEVLIFDSCGHVPMIEKTKETHDAILRFFEEI